MLDLADEGYLAAVDAQRSALEDSSLTPSAQIIAEMRDRGQSFAEFTLDVSRAHADYFRSLGLSADKEALFKHAAERSLQRTEELEQQAAPSFEDYLASYFDEI
jgi:glutamate--cysteine ligase